MFDLNSPDYRIEEERELPTFVRTFMETMWPSGGDEAQPEDSLVELQPAPAGVCDDCREPTSHRFVIGKFAVCHGDALLRLKARSL